MDKKINPQFLTKTGQKLARGVAWPSTLTNLEGLGHSQDFSLGATGRAPKARELGRLRRRWGWDVGRGCTPPRRWWDLGSAWFFGIFSCRAFCVAISYHLAACFTRIGSTCGIEIYWRSFQHFWNYYTPFRKIALKTDKSAPKISKHCAKIAVFVHFPYLFSKHFEGGDWREGITPSNPPPWLRPWNWPNDYLKLVKTCICSFSSSGDVSHTSQCWMETLKLER